jgi:hypothetical protein
MLACKEIAYFFLTGPESNAQKQIKYPLEGIFMIEPKKSVKNIATPSKTGDEKPLYFSIQARTPKGIGNRILKLLPKNTKEKAFLIDQNLSITPEDRGELYHFLCQNFKYVYLMDSAIEKQNVCAEFTEIFPDESMIMLFEKVPEFKDISWDEPLKNNYISPNFHTLSKKEKSESV